MYKLAAAKAAKTNVSHIRYTTHDPLMCVCQYTVHSTQYPVCHLEICLIYIKKYVRCTSIELNGSHDDGMRYVCRARCMYLYIYICIYIPWYVSERTVPFARNLYVQSKFVLYTNFQLFHFLHVRVLSYSLFILHTSYLCIRIYFIRNAFSGINAVKICCCSCHSE